MGGNAEAPQPSGGRHTEAASNENASESYLPINNIISPGLKCVMSMILIKIGVDLNGIESVGCVHVCAVRMMLSMCVCAHLPRKISQLLKTS